MNNTGIITAQQVAQNYFGIVIDAPWLLDHEAKINTMFPTDKGYEYTFTGECELGTLSDTCPRWNFMDAIAYIMTGKVWPQLCDRSQYDEFFIEFKDAINKADNIYLMSEKIC